MKAMTFRFLGNHYPNSLKNSALISLRQHQALGHKLCVVFRRNLQILSWGFVSTPESYVDRPRGEEVDVCPCSTMWKRIEFIEFSESSKSNR